MMAVPRRSATENLNVTLHEPTHLRGAERHRAIPSLALLAGLCIALAAGTAAARANDADLWSQYRGPGADGGASDGLIPDGEFGLAVQWTREIGSGYSGISVSNGRLFTQFSRDENDLIAAFDASTGEEIWSHVLGARYVGHDGSDDGPLSTPSIVDGTVYAVGPRGQVVALDAATGAERWTFQLDASNSTVPHYGYTTSPLITDDLILLATGGDGRALSALDRGAGTLAWSAGNGSVHYQTPSLMNVGGRDVAVLVSNQHLHGIDVASGSEIWSLQHTEGNTTEESSHVVQAGNGRFLVNFQGGSRLYAATADAVEEVWRSRAFGNSLAIPAYFDGHFYGFSRGILTAVDAQSGEIAWRSREPGGQGLTRIGDRLAMISADGELVIAAADPTGYREITRVAALEGASTHAPSFADGAFLVRNLAQMAAVAVDIDASPTTGPVEVTERLRGEFGEWIAEVERLPIRRRQAAVDRRWSSVERTPILGSGENVGLAHFVWRGEAEDVAVGGDPVANQEQALERIEGTDLFFRSLELHPAAQYNYTLSVDYGQPQPDPGNPFSTDQGFAVWSDLRMPNLAPAPHLDEPAADAPRGRVDTFPFRSVALGSTRQIQIWRPADYGSNPEREYPLLVVNHGDNQVRGALMTRTLDNLVGKSVAPLVAVFVPRVAPAEYGGDQADAYNRFLVDELIPHLQRHYRIQPNGYGAMGPGSAGVASLYAAVSHPELFDRVAVQSYYPIDPAFERIQNAVASGSLAFETILVSTSNRDYPPVATGRVGAQEASQELVELLRGADLNPEVLVTEYSPGWGGWRGQHDDILEALFPHNGE